MLINRFWPSHCEPPLPMAEETWGMEIFNGMTVDNTSIYTPTHDGHGNSPGKAGFRSMTSYAYT